MPSKQPALHRIKDLAHQIHDRLLAHDLDGFGKLLSAQISTGSIEPVEDAHLIVAHSLCVTLRSELRRAAVNDILLPNGHADRAEPIPITADAT